VSEIRLYHLRPGDKIRLTPDGPVREIKRVTSGAAYYTVESEKTYEVFDTKTGTHTPITRKGIRVEYISASAAVEMVEEAPRPAPRTRVYA